MEMSYDVFKEIRNEYASTILSDDDAFAVMDYVADMLDAEAEATAQNYPAAIAVVKRLRDAAREVRHLGYDVSDMVADREMMA